MIKNHVTPDTLQIPVTPFSGSGQKPVTSQDGKTLRRECKPRFSDQADEQRSLFPVINVKISPMLSFQRRYKKYMQSLFGDWKLRIQFALEVDLIYSYKLSPQSID